MKKVFIVKLKKPFDRTTFVDPGDEEEEMEDEDSDVTGGVTGVTGVVTERPMISQVLDLLKLRGSQGITQQSLAQHLACTHYEARQLCRRLKQEDLADVQLDSAGRISEYRCRVAVYEKCVYNLIHLRNQYVVCCHALLQIFVKRHSYCKQRERTQA